MQGAAGHGRQARVRHCTRVRAVSTAGTAAYPYRPSAHLGCCSKLIRAELSTETVIRTAGSALTWGACPCLPSRARCSTGPAPLTSGVLAAAGRGPGWSGPQRRPQAASRLGCWVALRTLCLHGKTGQQSPGLARHQRCARLSVLSGGCVLDQATHRAVGRQGRCSAAAVLQGHRRGSLTWPDLRLAQCLHLQVFISIACRHRPASRLHSQSRAAAGCMQHCRTVGTKQRYQQGQCRLLVQPVQLGCASGNIRSTGLCWHVPYLAGPDACSQAPAATGPGAQSAAPPAAPPPLLLLPADLMRYDRPPGPGSVVGGAGMGPGVLLENGLPGAVLGVPGLLLLLLTLTTAMLSLVCAKPPICSRSMRFCRQVGCASCSALGDELMSMPVLSSSSAALCEDAAATAA